MPELISIVRPGHHQADGSIVLVRAVQTAIACPSQWDAWDADGTYYYLRHRCGRGSVDTFPDPDPDTWGDAQLGGIAHFEGPLDIEDDRAEFVEFCRLAGLTVAEDIDLVTYEEFIAKRCKE